MPDDAVSQRIRYTLKDLGIKQSFLAAKLEMTPQGLSRMLKVGGVDRSKYLPKIADALDVTEYYLITGNDRPVLVVSDEQLKRLINDKFELQEEEKAQLNDFKVESTESDIFFAYKLKIPINAYYTAGSLAVFCPEVPKEKFSGKIYMILSNISQSFIVGKYSEDKQNLINLNGNYLITPNDQFVGHATQIIVYLDN